MAPQSVNGGSRWASGDDSAPDAPPRPGAVSVRVPTNGEPSASSSVVPPEDELGRPQRYSPMSISPDLGISHPSHPIVPPPSPPTQRKSRPESLESSSILSKSIALASEEKPAPVLHTNPSQQDRLSATMNATSAESMIQVASQAGLHSVSSGLATRTDPQALSVLPPHGFATLNPPLSSSKTSHLPSAADTPPLESSVHPRRASSSADYSAAMNAHISTALRGVQQLSGNLSSQNPSSTTISSPQTSHSAAEGSNVLAARMHMAEIATRTAIEEAEKQLRLQALVRASLPTRLVEANAHDLPPQRSSNDTLFRALGLSQIPVPSQGLEQPWGRIADSGVPEDSHKANASRVPSRYYDASDAFSGVPSLPCE